MDIIEKINSLVGVRTLPTQGMAEIEKAEKVLQKQKDDNRKTKIIFFAFIVFCEMISLRT